MISDRHTIHLRVIVDSHPSCYTIALANGHIRGANLMHPTGDGVLFDSFRQGRGRGATFCPVWLHPTSITKSAIVASRLICKRIAVIMSSCNLSYEILGLGNTYALLANALV